MSINMTLVGQMITFALFVWFTMKFVWPLLEQAMKERQQKIAEGLHAAERGHKELEIAQKNATKTIREARQKATEMIDQAHKQAAVILDLAKEEANRERSKIVELGRSEIENERRVAKAELREESVKLAVLTAEKILKRSIDSKDQQGFLTEGMPVEH